MIRIKKTFSVFFVVLFLLSPHSISVSALESGGIMALDEIDLPQDLNFCVNTTCSKHVCFMQATAREDGCFAIYSRYIDTAEYSGNSFKKAYIDIYYADGSFYRELSFTTPLDLAIELTETSVNIYFYTSVIVYDLETQELRHYSIPSGTIENEGVFQKLRSEEFVCGDWKYMLEKSFDGYLKLTRSNDDQIQVLIEMPGTGNSFWNVLFPGIVSGIIGITVIAWIIKRRKREAHQ